SRRLVYRSSVMADGTRWSKGKLMTRTGHSRYRARELAWLMMMGRSWPTRWTVSAMSSARRMWPNPMPFLTRKTAFPIQPPPADVLEYQEVPGVAGVCGGRGRLRVVARWSRVPPDRGAAAPPDRQLGPAQLRPCRRRHTRQPVAR